MKIFFWSEDHADGILIIFTEYSKSSHRLWYVLVSSWIMFLSNDLYSKSKAILTPVTVTFKRGNKTRAKRKRNHERVLNKKILYFASCSEEEISKKTNHRVHAREQAKALSIHAKLHILFHAFPIQHIKSTILPVIWLTVFDCVWRTTYRTSTSWLSITSS